VRLASVASMEQMVTVGRDVVWVDEHGVADGPPVVLLHPGVGTSTIYDAVVPELARDLRVVRFDKRGFGRSPAPTEPFDHAQDLLAVLDALDIRAAHLVGNSMGGGAALDVAVRAPERVASLTLLCPGVSGYDWPDDPGAEEFEKLASSGDLAGLIELAIRTWAAAGDDQGARQQVTEAASAWQLEAEYEQEGEPAWPHLGSIVAPTTVMIGGLDHPPLVACNEELVRVIPGAQAVRMPEVDHLPSLRDPALVVRTVRDTVTRAGQPPGSAPPVA
jgi:3-oxoadipate enol-lactonase